MAILFLIVFIDLVGFGLMFPLLPFYSEYFGASPALVTLLLSCYSFAQFFTSPIWGRLSDRYGRKPILISSLCFAIIAYLWMSFASALWMLFAARLLQGAGAGNIAAAQAYIADITTPEKRAKGMGMIGAAFGLGFTIGPALGGLLAGNHPDLGGLSRPPLAAAGFSALALLLTIFLLRESLIAANRARERASRWTVARAALARPALRQILSLFFITTAAFAGMEATFALWAQDAFGWGPETVGMALLYVGVVLIIMQGGLVGRLAQRFGEQRLVGAGVAILALGLIGLPLSHAIVEAVLAMGLLAIGMGLFSPSLNSLLSFHAGVSERGGIMGVGQSAASLARVLGPIVAGALFDHLGRNAPYYLSAAIMALMVLLALRLPPSPASARATAERGAAPL
jgi:DHA1 family tetracycline resistance protein-like MFS transporter